MSEPTTDLITENQNQADVIRLDLDRNQITVNQQFTESLAKAPEIIAAAEKLVKTDVNDLDEDDMSNLRKDFKPIVKYQKQYEDFEKNMKRMLKARDQRLIDSFHQRLTDAGFDKIPQLTKQYRAIDHDFKANRANRRWAQIKDMFDASMSTYPEFQKFAPDTLGSFSFYRLHHPDLVSEAKNKPVNKATETTFNQDLYQYHQDLKRLLESTLNPVYYPRIIEQYADDSTTSNMLALIKRGLERQIKDEHAKLIAQVTPTAQRLLGDLWYDNAKVNSLLDQAKGHEILKPEEFETKKLTLMRNEADAILGTLQAEQFVKDQAVDTDALELTLKPLLVTAAKRIYQQLNNIQPASEKPKQVNQPKPKPTVPQDPNAWLLDLLQAQGKTNVHNNNQIKVSILQEMFANITNRSSVWREHLNSYDDIMNLVKYITQL